jgi:DNA modification methylase
MAGLEPNHVYQKDCLEGLAAIAAGSVTLAFADPPFNIGYDYDVYHDKKGSGEYLDWTRKWMAGVVNTLSPTGTFWLAIGDEYAAELKLIAQNELGLTCRSWVIWYYTFGVNCKFNFSRSHTHLFHFVRDPKRFTFNNMEIRVPSARQLVYNDSRADAKGRLPDNTWILRPQDMPLAFNPDEDTWYFPRVCGTFKERAGWHGCQMPEQLLGRIIRACSNPGDLVLDPFGGSGTTFAVARKLSRKYIGFELSPEYARRIGERLNAIKAGDPLDGAEDPLSSAPRTPGITGSKSKRVKSARRPVAEVVQVAVEPRIRPKPAAVIDRSTMKTITEAFLRAHAGFSIDRVLADPGLNAGFIAVCRDLGIPGHPVNWNRCLLGLRKAGKLRALPRTCRTAFSRSQMDGFLFASEMAWAFLARKHQKSLDDLLCDPDIAAEFDSVAARFAPGWEPLHYRWGALHTRKEAFRKKQIARRLPPEVAARRFAGRGLHIDDVDRVPAEQGVYLLQSNGDNLYLGQTADLHARICCHVTHLDSVLSAFCPAPVSPTEVRVRVLSLGDRPEAHRLGLQSLLLGGLKTSPLANASYERQASLP